eukprot:366477-Chlamydomonas_euryale.AAC.9
MHGGSGLGQARGFEFGTERTEHIPVGMNGGGGRGDGGVGGGVGGGGGDGVGGGCGDGGGGGGEQQCSQESGVFGRA